MCSPILMCFGTSFPQCVAILSITSLATLLWYTWSPTLVNIASWPYSIFSFVRFFSLGLIFPNMTCKRLLFSIYSSIAMYSLILSCSTQYAIIKLTAPSILALVCFPFTGRTFSLSSSLTAVLHRHHFRTGLLL